MNIRSTKQVACPQCGELSAFSPDNPYRPFCSERCKMMDLGAWASESYRIESPLQDPLQTSSLDDISE
jgi:endogenous inhibitor of DNA gyrase (YacG/DUF329 family)